MRKEILKEIICRDLGLNSYAKYSAYRLEEFSEISKHVSNLLSLAPPSFGSCVMLSATLAAILQEKSSIPAIAVLGDLLISEFPIFECKKNLPSPRYDGDEIRENWDGHCWVEIDDAIIDVSIFRSAYSVSAPSLLKSFIVSNFGMGKGALLSTCEQLPSGMEFRPKFALTDVQIDNVLMGFKAEYTNI